MIDLAIGERIHFFRTLRGMTQKYLGRLIGFPEKSADVRMAQYENGSRKPKEDVTSALAAALDVSTHALNVPDIDSMVGLMHTLFTLEDKYGLCIDKKDEDVCLCVNVFKGNEAVELNKMLTSWYEESLKLKSGEIDKEEYDRWRYKYPEFDTSRIWAKTHYETLKQLHDHSKR